MALDLALRELTEDEYAAYRLHLREGYAEEMVSLGHWDRESAQAKAAKDCEQMLPEGAPAADQVIRVAEQAGQRVGVVWIGPASDTAPSAAAAALYGIEVGPDRRGEGLGRLLLAAAERLAVDLGYRRLGLNVFAGNERAIHLYQGSGYQVMQEQMVKDI